MKRIPAVIFLALFACTYASGQTPDILEYRDKISITREDSLNSAYLETNLSISPDGRYLYFRSDRGSMPWSRYGRTYKSNCRADGDIYCSTRENNVWHKAGCLPNTINTGEAQDEPYISSGGKTIIYQSWTEGWEYNRGPYYIAKLSGNTWSDPIGLGGGINEFFKKQMDKYKKSATDGMCISPDGNTLIFAWGLEYNSALDLYISKKKNGEWSFPERLSLSTDKDERSVSISCDGKTLYFASGGYKGSGGLDIFKASINSDGTYGEVVNLGEPFNSAQDDYGFIMTASGNEAYFVREGDIYRAGFADTVIKPLPLETPVAAKSEVGGSVPYYKIFRDYSVVINYEYNRDDIKEKYYKDLRKVADTLKSNPSLKLDVFGHADTKGSEEYNLELGYLRAKMVKHHLTDLGIDPGRIYILSFGEYKPVVPAEKAGQDVAEAKNRRCEIWVKR